MHLIAKFRIVWAILGIAFLLLNPAGVCAGTPGTASPSHPCCPPAHGPTPQAPSSCICIDRQPAAPALPALADQGPVVAVAVNAAAGSTLEPPAPSQFVAFSHPVRDPQDLPVSFHQLLL